MDVLSEGFTVYTVNVSECKYRADTNYSFHYWVICSEKCPSENLIWKLPTQCPRAKASSLPALFLTNWKPNKLDNDGEANLTTRTREWLQRFISTCSLFPTQLQQIIGQTQSVARWWSSWQTLCLQHCARLIHVCPEHVCIRCCRGDDPAALWSPSQKFSGLANTVGEITWQTKHNRLTRYANTHTYTGFHSTNPFHL